MTEISATRLETAVSSIAAEISSHLARAPKVQPQELGLWAELSCCILSSQVPYDLARAASQRIVDSGVFCSDGSPKQDALRSHLLCKLSAPVAVGGTFRRYRFPQRRADQLASTFCVVHQTFGSLGQLLRHYPDARSTREWMVKNMQGIGPKQASMFLRNVAVSYDLAIIDRHVRRYVYLIGLADSDVGVASVREYEELEAKLRVYATTAMACPLGILDWAIWIVMRAASRIGCQ
jgi:N-glycosylase/DNA lyase